jgi:hypothetical protein
LDVVDAEFELNQDVLNITQQFGEDSLRGYIKLEFVGFAGISVFGLPSIHIPFDTTQKMEPVELVVNQISDNVN